MPRWSSATAGLIAFAGATAGVIEKMKRDHESSDTFQPATVAAMYGTYVGGTALFCVGVARRMWPVPVPIPMRIAASAVAASGAMAAAKGIVVFDSPEQLSGTDAGKLHTDDLYRWSRNPQYVGIAAAAGGAAVASGSAFAAAVAAIAIRAYSRWVPSEERHLERIFGTEFTEYVSRVPRWLTLSPRSR